MKKLYCLNHTPCYRNAAELGSPLGHLLEPCMEVFESRAEYWYLIVWLKQNNLLQLEPAKERFLSRFSFQMKVQILLICLRSDPPVWSEVVRTDDLLLVPAEWVKSVIARIETSTFSRPQIQMIGSNGSFTQMNAGVKSTTRYQWTSRYREVGMERDVWGIARPINLHEISSLISEKHQ